MGPPPGPSPRAVTRSGAVGGFDALRAAHRLDPLRTVTLTTSKPASVLVQPDWMDPDRVARPERGEERLEVFLGSAREAAGRFPRSVKVSATLALAALGLDETSDRTFTDVPSGSTFATDINKLATAGITKGCNPSDNTRFCPDNGVLRQQMAAFLHRALG